MEQQEEKKKRKDHIRRRRQSKKSTLSFPTDLTSEILLRLPVKSLERFRCVSKLWSSIITDSYFINLFETRSPRPSLLLCFQKDDNLFVSSIPQHSKISNKSYSFSQPTDHYHITFPRHEYPFTESVHGLVCFLETNGTPRVWNPSKRQLLTLPKPHKISSRDVIRVFLGYDPIEGKHKLVCMPVEVDIHCDVRQVLILGSAQESWRTVKTNPKHRYGLTPTHGRCVKGVIYYQAYIRGTGVWVIMSFDVRSEIFYMIQLPCDFYAATLITYEGKLACVEYKTTNRYSYRSETLFILEDAEKHEWSSENFLAPPFPHDWSLGTDFDLKGITHAGEFIYAPSEFCKSYYILFYDPVRSSYRRFEFKGIADDEYWLNNEPRLHVFPNHNKPRLYVFPNHNKPRLYVFPNHNKPRLYVFPNHIQSLRSL